MCAQANKSTAVTAFVGSAARGSIESPVHVRGIAEFKREFGELSPEHPLTYAVHQFFENGGRHALVVRVAGAGDSGAERLTDDLVSAPALQTSSRGLWALDKAEAFNLLCIPPFAVDVDGDVGAQTRRAAADYCLTRRAMFIVDPLAGWLGPDALRSGSTGLDSSVWGLPASPNAALYFPRVRVSDMRRPGQTLDCAPCGAVAGVYARTDGARGVWKAPAGQEATLVGVTGLTVALTDAQNGQLNPMGVNCLRTFPSPGVVVWGARTLMGADALASDWKYVPVRRLALHIESALADAIADTVRQGADGAVADGEPLWAMLRQRADAFLHDLFRAGAFAGTSSREAYFVKCDRTTMTQEDIDAGRLVMQVGVAPVKPAEFVIFPIGQWKKEP
jgi:phage tail sheath protein FI